MPGPDEDLLGQVVRGIVTRHSPREAVNSGHTRAIQPLESDRISICGQGDVPALSLHGGSGSQIAQLSLPVRGFLLQTL